MVLAPDGTIDNASSASITEAIANGFVSGTSVVGITETQAPDAQIQLYPNPTNGLSHIALNLTNQTEVTVEIYSIDGKRIASKYYGSLNGNVQLPIQSDRWNNGMYKIKVITNDSYSVYNLIKQ
jgi:hypothetical protein